VPFALEGLFKIYTNQTLSQAMIQSHVADFEQGQT